LRLKPDYTENSAVVSASRYGAGYVLEVDNPMNLNLTDEQVEYALDGILDFP
jgi:hypothetical protein